MKPRKSRLRVGSCTKLAPKFCGLFNILEIVGLMAYRLASPPTSKAHDLFQIYLFKKYVSDINHVCDTGGIWGSIPIRTIVYLGLEVDCTLESSNRVGQGALKALWTRWNNLGNYRSNEGTLNFFVHYINEHKRGKYKV